MMNSKLLFLSFFCLSIGLSAQQQTIFSDIKDKTITTSVYFASASDKISEEATTVLTALSENLAGYPGYSITIKAYTDEQGTEAYNNQLAERRAAAIESVLQEKGIKATNQRVLTFGESEATRNTIDDRARKTDRRVDLVTTVQLWANNEQISHALQEGLLQTFTHQAKDPITIRGKKGGHFALDPNSFVRMDGSAVTGDVTIELTEAYELSDMLALGLVTVSDGKMLETGGMVNLQARDSEGNKLKLGENKQVSAAIPTTDFDERMQLFTGESHSESDTPDNWRLSDRQIGRASFLGLPRVSKPQPLEEFIKNDRSKKLTYLTLLKRACDYTTYDDNAFLSLKRWIRNNPMPRKKDYLSRLDPVRNVLPTMRDTSSMVYQGRGSKKLFGRKAVVMKGTRAMREHAVKSYNRKLERFERRTQYNASLPEQRAEAYQAFVRDSLIWDARVMSVVDRLSTEEGKKRFYRAIAVYKREQALYESRQLQLEAQMESQTDITSGQMNQYFFVMTELTWMNCDRFWGAEQQVRLLANLPGSDGQSHVLLIPDEAPAILRLFPGQGNLWTVDGIAKGLSGKVIAYDVMNGQMRYAEQHMIDYSGEEQVQLNFEPISLKDLKQRMAQVSPSK